MRLVLLPLQMILSIRLPHCWYFSTVSSKGEAVWCGISEALIHLFVAFIRILQHCLCALLECFWEVINISKFYKRLHTEYKQWQPLLLSAMAAQCPYRTCCLCSTLSNWGTMGVHYHRLLHNTRLTERSSHHSEPLLSCYFQLEHFLKHWKSKLLSRCT